MSAPSCCAAMALFFGVSCWAQPGSSPRKVDLCELYTHPAEFAGKMIEVRATIVGRHEPSIESPASSRQASCSAYMSIALELPGDVTPRPAFDFEQGAPFQEYQEAIRRPTRIEATLVGRFDPAFVWKDRHRLRAGDGPGFGKKHSADARLVLRSMSEVVVWTMPRR